MQGPFTMSIDDYGACKGPKSKNLTIMTTSVDKQLLVGTINFAYLTDTKIEEVSITVFYTISLKKENTGYQVGVGKCNLRIEHEKG